MCYQEIWEREVISLSLILSGFWYLLSSTRCGNNTLAWLNLLTKSFIKKIHDKNSMSNIIIGNFCTHFRKGEIQPFNRLWPLRSTKYCLRQHYCSSEPYVQPFFKFMDESSGRGHPKGALISVSGCPEQGLGPAEEGRLCCLEMGPVLSLSWFIAVDGSLQCPVPCEPSCIPVFPPPMLWQRFYDFNCVVWKSS